MCLLLEDMGFEIEASHHECAPGQHEIDFKYAPALTAADYIMTFKLVVKTIAKQHGLHATFMPKPVFGIAGNGMHMNVSLFKDGQNAFYDPQSQTGLSEVGRNALLRAFSRTHGNLPPSPTRWSTPISGLSRAMRRRCTSRGPPITEAR